MGESEEVIEQDGLVADEFEAIYSELKRLARNQMSLEKGDHTLQPTALIHEAFLRIGKRPSPDGTGSLMSMAAEAMRRVLVDHARKRNSLKRGGEHHRIDLDLSFAAATMPSNELIALSEALDLLESEDERKAELVKLRFFGGLSHQEAAKLMGISRPTADRYWAYSRVRMFQWINDALGKVKTQ